MDCTAQVGLADTLSPKKGMVEIGAPPPKTPTRTHQLMQSTQADVLMWGAGGLPDFWDNFGDSPRAAAGSVASAF